MIRLWFSFRLVYNSKYVYSKLKYIEVLLSEELLKTCCLDTVYIVKTNVGSYRVVATEEGGRIHNSRRSSIVQWYKRCCYC